MIIRDPLPFDKWPNSTFEEIDQVTTTPEMPIVNGRNKVVVRDLWQPPQEEWTPPPYWKELLYVEQTKFERTCKTWFVKIMFVFGTLYVLALISIFLWKLLMVVIALR